MPHDVATQWNSTFDMLAFALQYQVAIDNIGNKTANLCQYELSDYEWRIAEQLYDMLKVRVCLCILKQNYPHPPSLKVPNFNG